jgi:phage-related protein
LGDRQGEAGVLSRLGTLAAQQNQSSDALRYYAEAVNVLETVRKDLRGLPIEQRRSFINSVADTYRAYAQLLEQQGQSEESQRILELLQAH